MFDFDILISQNKGYWKGTKRELSFSEYDKYYRKSKKATFDPISFDDEATAIKHNNEVNNLFVSNNPLVLNITSDDTLTLTPDSINKFNVNDAAARVYDIIKEQDALRVDIQKKQNMLDYGNQLFEYLYNHYKAIYDAMPTASEAFWNTTVGQNLVALKDNLSAIADLGPEGLSSAEFNYYDSLSIRGKPAYEFGQVIANDGNYTYLYDTATGTDKVYDAYRDVFTNEVVDMNVRRQQIGEELMNHFSDVEGISELIPQLVESLPVTESWFNRAYDYVANSMFDFASSVGVVDSVHSTVNTVVHEYDRVVDRLANPAVEGTVTNVGDIVADVGPALEGGALGAVAGFEIGGISGVIPGAAAGAIGGEAIATQFGGGGSLTELVGVAAKELKYRVGLYGGTILSGLVAGYLLVDGIAKYFNQTDAEKQFKKNYPYNQYSLLGDWAPGNADASQSSAQIKFDPAFQGFDKSKLNRHGIDFYHNYPIGDPRHNDRNILQFDDNIAMIADYAIANHKSLENVSWRPDSHISYKNDFDEFFGRNPIDHTSEYYNNPDNLTNISYSTYEKLRQAGATDQFLYPFKLDINTLPTLTGKQLIDNLHSVSDWSNKPLRLANNEKVVLNESDAALLKQSGFRGFNKGQIEIRDDTTTIARPSNPTAEQANEYYTKLGYKDFTLSDTTVDIKSAGSEAEINSYLQNKGFTANMYSLSDGIIHINRTDLIHDSDIDSYLKAQGITDYELTSDSIILHNSSTSFTQDAVQSVVQNTYKIPPPPVPNTKPKFIGEPPKQTANGTPGGGWVDPRSKPKSKNTFVQKPKNNKKHF